MQWERGPECVGPKRNRVLGGGKRASERVNRRCDERLLETVRLGVVAPGLAASEERHGAGRLRHDDMLRPYPHEPIRAHTQAPVQADCRVFFRTLETVLRHLLFSRKY